MIAPRMYSLHALQYDYAALAPAISEEQLRLQHRKHHQAYGNGANAVLEKLYEARKENIDLNMKASLKELAFHIGGNTMHTMFWENMAPAGKGGGGAPLGKIGELITAEFGSFERFKKEFSQAANSVEGSEWAALTVCRGTIPSPEHAGGEARRQYVPVPNNYGARCMGTRLLCGLPE